MQILQKNGEYGLYDEENEEVIATGVKELYNCGEYLTENDEFVSVIDNRNVEPVNDVLKYYGDQLIWTKDKKLYKKKEYDFNEAKNVWECNKFKISDNVKQVSEDDYCVYITENNEIYLMDFYFNPEKIGEVDKNIKQLTRNYYLTTEDELYTIDGTKQAEDVKELYYYGGRTYYKTNNNELYYLYENYDDNTESETIFKIKIDENIQDAQEYIDRRICYKKNNIVYSAIYNDEESKVEKTKILEGVKEYDTNDGYYTTLDNTLYSLNGIKIAEKVLKGYVHDYDGFYEKIDGSIYFMYKTTLVH